MNNNFRLINNMKKFIFSLDNIIINFPKKDLVLKDKIYITSYEVLELIFWPIIKIIKLQHKRRY